MARQRRNKSTVEPATVAAEASPAGGAPTIEEPSREQPARANRPKNTRQAASDDDVRRRAYDLYEQRGREHGRDWDDWFAAERDLR